MVRELVELLVAGSVVAAAACSGAEGDGPSASGAPGVAGGTTSPLGGASGSASAGAPATPSGGAAVTSGAGSGGSAVDAGGSSTNGGSGGGVSLGGAMGGTSPHGTAGRGAGAAGTPTSGAGGGGSLPPPPLDCGKQGWAVENHGPPKNRVNYVILADGYTAATVETTLVEHIEAMLERRFQHESGQPYGRYRKFVNICVMKALSQTDGIGRGPTAFDGGNGGDRLAAVNSTKVNDYIKANVPASFEIDWKAVVLNQALWENTGSILMLWSGGADDAPGAALHEGGHGFHQLADEYCAKGTGARCGENTNGSGNTGMEYPEVNSTGDPETTDQKWDLWLGTTQKGLNVPDEGATGLQGTFVGSRYVDTGQYRPSANSMMNSLFGLALDTSFNSVSREQIIFSIWRAVVPIDSTDPPQGAVTAPPTLTVNVIDPAVIDVDWTVDGVTTPKAGTSFSTASLAPGTHTISAKAYDNATTDLVKYRSGKCQPSVTRQYCHATAWPRSEQTVTWTVTIP